MGFRAFGRSLYHMGVIWSNKESLLRRMIKGWPKSVVLVPWGFLLRHEWPCYAMHVPIDPWWYCCSNLDVLAPLLMPIAPPILLVATYGDVAPWRSCCAIMDPSWYMMHHIDSFVVTCCSKYAKKMMMLRNVPKDATWRIVISWHHSWAYGPIWANGIVPLGF